MELPSEKAERKAKEKSKKESEKEAEESRLRGAMARTFSTDDGIIVLRWLRDQCGHNKPVLGALGGKIDPDATVYQAMRLNLYLTLRGYLDKRILMEIEL